MCFLALVLARELELRLNRDNEDQNDEKISAEKAMEVLGRLKAVAYRVGSTSILARIGISSEAKEILKRAGIKELPVFMQVLD